MATEEPKDPMEGMTWKSVYKSVTAKLTNQPGQVDSSQPGQPVKKRLPRKIRPIPEHYFVPRYSWPKTLAFYGACIAGGIGTGMLLDVWMKKKIERDGDEVIYEFKG